MRTLEKADSPPFPPRRRRPLVPPVLALAGGILAAEAAGVWGASVLLLLAAATGPAVRRKRTDLALLLLCTGVGFLVGWSRMLAHRAPPPPGHVGRIPEGPPMPVRVRARAIHKPGLPAEEQGETVFRFVVETEAIEKRGRWAEASGGLRVKLTGADPGIDRNDRIELVGMLIDLPDPGNPAQFDFGDHLENLGVGKILSVPSPENVVMLERGGFGIRRTVEAIRHRLLGAIGDAFPPEDGALLSALLLGEPSRLDPGAREVFARSGTVHLLAVSGLHLMLVVSGFFFLLKLLGIRGRPAAVLIIAFVWLFVLLTGSRTPVMRAGIMTTVYFGAQIFGRERDSWNALALSGGILLLHNPSRIFAPGFQLSFAAVAGILAFTEPIAGRLVREEALVLKLSTVPEDRLRAKIAHLAGLSVSVSLAAWIATAPLVLHHFNLLTPVVPLANLVAGPMTALLLGLGFLTLPLLLLFPGPGVLALPAGVFARLLTHSARFFADLPFSHLYLPHPSPARLAAGYLCLLLLAWKPRWPGRLARLHWTLPAGMAGLFFFFPAPSARPAGMELAVLDVGQGSSSVLRFPDGRVMVYDAGTRGGFDVGSWVVAPFLWSRGITRIDLLVLSHPDEDHISAVPEILRRFRVEAAAVPVGFRAWPEGEAVIRALQRHGARIHALHRGASPPAGWEEILEILHPPRRRPDTPFLSRNNTSLTLAVSWAGRRILLPGDLERLGLTFLSGRPGGSSFDVIVAPHHGSNEVEGNAPLARGRPCIVIMSCGVTFGVEKTEALYLEHGARVFKTWRDGAVTVRIARDGSMESEAFRGGVESDVSKRPETAYGKRQESRR